MVTSDDIWNEFVYYRKNGHSETAHEYIRPHRSQARWEIVIAMLIHHRYPGKLRPGDTVNVGDILTFNWDEELDKLSDMVSDELSSSHVSS